VDTYAVELPSGKRLWETTKPVSDRPAYSGTAFIVRQGDKGQRYWLFNERGQIIIANLTPTGYEEIDRTQQLIEALLGLYAAAAAGECALVSADAATLAGRPIEPVSAFIRRAAA